MRAFLASISFIFILSPYRLPIIALFSGVLHRVAKI
jgi:hypothetical protein